jgi:hypothetical protein
LESLYRYLINAEELPLDMRMPNGRGQIVVMPIRPCLEKPSKRLNARVPAGGNQRQVLDELHSDLRRVENAIRILEDLAATEEAKLRQQRQISV